VQLHYYGENAAIEGVRTHYFRANLQSSTFSMTCNLKFIISDDPDSGN
jgi:hypothetical protein